MTQQELHITPYRKLISEKIGILARFHSFCASNEITYFAVDGLAGAAQSGGRMVEKDWKVALMRDEYVRFLRQAPKAGFRVKKGRILELTHPEEKHSLFVDVFDAVPSQKQDEFLQEIAKLRDCGDTAALERLATKYNDDPDAQMRMRLMSGDGVIMHRALLYPVMNRAFENIKICVPFDCTLWTTTESQLVARQKREILRLLDPFCTEQEIPYFAITKLDVSSRLFGDLRPDFGKNAMEIGVLRHYFDDFAALVNADPRFTVFYADRSGKPNGAVYITLTEYVENDQQPEAVVVAIPYDYLPQEEKARKRFLAQMKKANDEYNATYSADRGRKRKQAADMFKELSRASLNFNDCQGEGVRYIARVQGMQSKVLACHHVFPLVRSKMADFEINCPNNPYIWAENTNVAFHDAANEQKAALLKNLVRICEEHEVACFAVASLLIGMVTYEDFVPEKPTSNWDVALLRKDYEKILPILREKAGNYGLELSEFADDEQKIRRQTVMLTAAEPTWPDGALRLLPFDKVPEAYDTQYGFMRKLRELNDLFKAFYDLETTGATTYNPKKLAKARRKYGAEPLEALAKRIDALAQTYNDDADTHLYGRVAYEKSKFIPEDQLFPFAKGKIRGVEMNRPNDYSVWTPVLDEDLEIQVTSIQKADMLLIDKLDEICRKLDIGYFICGGSMLGYARNGGFIPWDDDIDVAMLRADYDRFMAEAGALLDDRFFLQTRQSDPEIPYLFSKLRLNNTEYITQYNERRAFHKGICLDIFPFDFIPNDPKEQEEFKKEVLALSAAHNRVVNNRMPEPIDPIKPRNARERYYKLYGKAKRAYFRSQSLRKTQQAYLAKATSLNKKAKELGLTTVASFVPSYTYIKLEDLLPYQDVLFDGHRVKVPRRPDVFLTMQYGDYLQLPPKHNRVAHRLLRWSVDLKAKKSGE